MDRKHDLLVRSGPFRNSTHEARATVTRFIYLSDSHLGTTPVGFQQQPAVPEHIEELVSALEEWITNQGDIAFVIHGGDMVNDATVSNIQRASRIFDLSVPVYLCLGNHDLDAPEALNLWLTHAPKFFIGTEPNFIIDHGNLHIAIMPNQWGDSPYYWNHELRPHFAPDQIAWMERQRGDKPGNEIQMLVTHSPVHAISPAQTGFGEPYHSPGSAFASDIARITELSPRLRCIVGAHSHINSCTQSNGMHFITSSAFVEAPFEFKVFNIDQNGISMETHNLAQSVSFTWNYDFNKTFVQGRQCDRTFRM